VSLSTAATVIAACVVFLTLVGAVAAWLYRRGRDEQSLSSSVDKQADATNRNTVATEMLAAQVGGLRDTLERHGNTLVEHDWRLKALEGSK
jgi:sensor domain CHASE-containing protein